MIETNEETAQRSSTGDSDTAPPRRALDDAHAQPNDSSDEGTRARGFDDLIDEVRPLAVGEIRARRRPRAVFFVWAWELACVLFIATPVHAWAARVWGTHPDGDAVLFHPGGHALLSWLGDDTSALAVVTRTSFLGFVIFGVLGQIVTGALVAALATGVGNDGRAPPTSFALRSGAAAFYPLLGIGVTAGAIQGLLIGVGLFVSSALDHGLQADLGDARAFTVRLVALALFIVLVLIVGVVADLARVSVARAVAIDVRRLPMGRRMRDAAIMALLTARQAIGRASFAWGWRAAIALALVYVGSLAGDAVGDRVGGTLWLLFFVHQLIILGRAGLRASWLANALRLVLR